MSGAPDAVGTVDVALAQAERLLATDARRAAELAAGILTTVPDHPVATLFLGIARRFTGDAAGSLAALEPLARSRPDWAAVQYELGQSRAAAGRSADAIAALRRAVELQPALPGAWHSLAGQLRAIGDDAGADAVCAGRIGLATRDPRLRQAESCMSGHRFAEAEAMLRGFLREDPTDVVALRMLAEIALQLGRNADAGRLLERCLELAPGFALARYHYAIALHRQGRHADALQEVDRLLLAEPRNPGFRNLQAVLLGRTGEFDRAVAVYADLLAEHPRQPRTWMSFGHALTAAGRQADGIAAYRKCVELSPEIGEAWWSLANLKTFRFAPGDIDEMRRHLDRPDLSGDDRLHFEFALGKALEDAGDHPGSFAHYAQANRLRRATAPYDASQVTSHVRRSKALLTSRFFAERAGCGSPAPDPVFIVGLPRSGSTLLEQILSSHPAVEGTMELPDLIALVRGLAERSGRADGSGYPEILAELVPEEFRALGERYLASTRMQRKTGAPMFIDKMPNNFAHVGFIHLILPNSRIIDMRRHPLACCFSNFKQHFARGQHFSYDLADIGRYYRDYVELLAHFDAALPGRVHRVFYERLVADTEAEVRRLLEYCGLPFAESCLQFHASDRPVRTASSEQVRQPIYQDGIDHWRRFERWLDPLKAALGPVLDSYPAVPPFEPANQG